jgi:hypothetical protein
MSNKNQGSRSDVNDSLGHTSKDRQRPIPANSQPGTTSTNVHESRDVVQKEKPTPAHLTHFHDLQGEHKESLREGAFPNRKHPGDAKEVPNGATRARRTGPHGHVIHADGSSQAQPNKHRIAKIG